MQQVRLVSVLPASVFLSDSFPSLIILSYMKCGHFPGRQEERGPVVPTFSPRRMSCVVSGSPVLILWRRKPGKPSQKLLFSQQVTVPAD